MESFFATLKKELVYLLHCAAMLREQVRQMIFRWIEIYYNRLRRNTANEENLLHCESEHGGRKTRRRLLNGIRWVCGFLDYSTCLQSKEPGVQAQIGI